MAEPWSDGDVLTAAHLAGLPWGVMGYVNGSASAQTGVAAQTDITSLSVTFTAVSSRLYKTTLVVQAKQITAGATATIFIADGANVVIDVAEMTLAANDFCKFVAMELVTGISGSITRKGRAVTGGGTVTINPDASATSAPRLIVEDAGPG